MWTKRFWHWTPRLLAVGFIIFLGLFALDVFSENVAIGEALVALFIHLTPNWLLLIVLVIAWRWRIVGGLLFWILGVGSLIYFNTLREPVTFLMISLPVFVIGTLFLLDALVDKRSTQRTA